MGSPPAHAIDALFGLLMPLWQLIIGVLVIVTVVVSIHRLFLRGPSRMGGAMLLTGGAVVCIAVVSFLVQQI
jgi:Na+/H+-dicarboxylate symporter